MMAASLVIIVLSHAEQIRQIVGQPFHYIIQI
jgi:hypothetical protein